MLPCLRLQVPELNLFLQTN